LESVGRYPAEGGDEAPSTGGLRLHGRIHVTDALLIIPLQGDNGGGKYLSAFPELEASCAKWPPLLPRHAKSVEMSLDAVVEIRQVFQRVVRCSDSRVPEEPQEGGLLGML